MVEIQEYSFGRIKIDDKVYTTDIIVFWDSVLPNWWRREGHSLCLEDIQEIINKEVRIIVIGTGAYGIMKVEESLIEEVKDRGIELEAYPTSRAISEFNKYAKRNLQVAGAFHLTC